MKLLKSGLEMHGEKVDLFATTYADKDSITRIALQLMTSLDEEGFVEPYARATVNVPAHTMPINHVLIKDWAENDGMSDWLIENGIIEPTILGGAICGFEMANQYALAESIWAECAELILKGEADHG